MWYGFRVGGGFGRIGRFGRFGRWSQQQKMYLAAGGGLPPLLRRRMSNTFSAEHIWSKHWWSCCGWYCWSQAGISCCREGGTGREVARCLWGGYAGEICFIFLFIFVYEEDSDLLRWSFIRRSCKQNYNIDGAKMAMVVIWMEWDY